jgi:hypothetical protein
MQIVLCDRIDKEPDQTLGDRHSTPILVYGILELAMRMKAG